MRKLIVELLSNRLGIVLVTINLVLLANLTPATVATTDDRRFFIDFVLLANFPAFLAGFILAEIADLVFHIQMVGTKFRVIVSIVSALQWLLVARFARQVAVKIESWFPIRLR